MRIPLAKPIFDEEMKDAAMNALQNERFVMGESVYKFEEEFANSDTNLGMNRSERSDRLRRS